jgi:predicted  nucleic acid-binding Zn-ribbon protein
MNLKHNWLSISLLTFCIGIFSPSIFAFKVDTHVWIGQQVINDLADDGKISIPVGGTIRTFSVEPEIVSSILNNQGSYRMGNIGPDAFPDIVTGQFVVHPGIETEWKTDDWLRFLLQSNNMKNDQRAFVYGYLSHAASDVFAHTYVNHYSGSIFEIMKEQKSGLSWDDAMVEEFRHFELEKYISSFNPPMKDVNGVDLGNAVDLLQTPTLFLRDKLIFNDEVSARNNNHLTLIHELRKSLISTGENELRQMDIMAVKIVVSYYTGYTPTDEQAGKLADLAQKINTFVSEHNGLDEAQAAKNEFINAIESVVQLDASIQEQLDNTVISIYSTLVNAIENANQQRVQIENDIVMTSAEHAKALTDFSTENILHTSLTDSLIGLNSNLSDLNSNLSDLSSSLILKQAELDQGLLDLANTVETIIIDTVCSTCLPWDILCKEVCNVVRDINPIYEALQSLISSLHSTIADINNQIFDLNSQIINFNGQILELNNQIHQKALKMASLSDLIDSFALLLTTRILVISAPH